MEFRPLLGVDQRSGPVAIDRLKSSDLLDVDLHPVGSVRQRNGCALWLDVDDEASDAILALCAMVQYAGTGKTYIYVATSAGLYRIDGEVVELVTAFAGAPEEVSAINSFYQADSNSLAPVNCGGAVYVATGQGMPLIDTAEVIDLEGGDAFEWPAGEYGSGELHSGTHGAPTNTSDLDVEDPRDWDADPPLHLLMNASARDDQIIAWGFLKDPSRIDHSEVGRPWNFLRSNVDEPGAPKVPTIDGGWFHCMPGDGDRVMSVSRLYDKLVVNKRRSVVVYTSGSPNEDGFAIQNVYPIGCVSRQCVMLAGNDLLWWSDQGPMRLSAVQQYGDLQSNPIGLPVWDIVSNQTAASVATISAYHDPANFRVVWTIPDNPSGARACVYYYDDPRRWTIYSGIAAGIRCTITPFTQYTGLYVLGGGNDGKLYFLNKGSTDGAADVVGYYITAWQDAGVAESRKRVIYIDVVVGDAGIVADGVQVGYDFIERFAMLAEPVEFFGDPGSYFDDAVFGLEDVNGDLLPLEQQPENVAIFDAGRQSIMRFAAVGTGRIFRVKFMAGFGRPWHIMGWLPQISEKGQR